MRILRELLLGIEILDSNVDLSVPIENVVIDSRKCQVGDLLVCLKGGSVDGHDFASEGVKNGARAIISERKLPNLPYVKVKNTRRAIALISANFYQNAHRALKIIGVIGTNGKTTTTYMLEYVLKRAGRKVAVLGTLGGKIENKAVSVELTTPDPMQMHSFFAQAKAAGIEYVIMEISAHAIFYRKTEGIKLDFGIFTNITQDHLDFFKDMAKYQKVKLQYFNSENMKTAIVNADDECGRKLIFEQSLPIVSYGQSNPSDVFVTDVWTNKGGTSFIVNAFDEISDISMPFWGNFNVYNAMATITTATSIGIDMPTIRQAMMQIPEVEGRFNVIKSENKTIIIDYAHTPDGLENLLLAAREMDGERVVSVFGCGGDRDKKKRSVMGEIAGKYSDFCVITSDNPRFEKPISIMKEIEKGVAVFGKPYVMLEDRETAIVYALANAEKGDKVIIAGKGGEEYIDELGIKRPYSDRKFVETILRRLYLC